jgi:hypothetical protein
MDEPISPPIGSEVAKSSVGLASFLGSALASCFGAAGFGTLIVCTLPNLRLNKLSASITAS